MSLYPQVPQGAGAHQPLHDEEDPSTNDPMPMHPVVQAQPVAVEAIAVDVQNDPPFAQVGFPPPFLPAPLRQRCYVGESLLRLGCRGRPIWSAAG